MSNYATYEAALAANLIENLRVYAKTSQHNGADTFNKAADFIEKVETQLAAANAEIERLTDMVRIYEEAQDPTFAGWAESEAQLAAAKARIAEAEKVIAPFAKAAELLKPRIPDLYDMLMYGGHLRVARVWMEGKSDQTTPRKET